MSGTYERGDYRIRRTWPLWVVERRWQGGWSRVAAFMGRPSAYVVFQELDDWQVVSTPEAKSIMRGDVLCPSVERIARIP